jgi:hypothetical protein
VLSFCCLAFRANAGDDLGPHVTESRKAELTAEAAAQSVSADQLWSYVQKWIAAEPSGATRRPGSSDAISRRNERSLRLAREDAAALAEKERNIRLGAACREFIRDFPADPRGWEARLLILEMEHGILSDKEYRGLCEEIIASSEAAKPIHDRARKLLLAAGNPETAQSAPVVTVTGRVRSPQTITFRSGLTVRDVTKITGGLSYPGSPGSLTVIRGSQRITVDLMELLRIHHGVRDESKNIKLLPGDTVEFADP